MNPELFIGMAVLNGILLPVVAFLIRMLFRVEKLVDKHEQCLFGPQGDNGVTSEIRLLRQFRHDSINKQTDHGVRLIELEGGPRHR